MEKQEKTCKFAVSRLTLTAFICLVSMNQAAADGLSENSCVHDETTLRCVEFLTNYDGDTITVTVPQALAIFGKRLSVRVKGVDTPELRTRDQCEKARAQQAKEFVKKELEGASRIDLQGVERGKYFRIVADVVYDGNNLSDHLVRMGYARPYHGGTKSNAPWCGKD